MLRFVCWLIALLSLSADASIPIPAPNGSYVVGLTILEMKNPDSIQPFAPVVEVPNLMLSVFYPTNEQQTVNIPYMDPITARFEGLEQQQNGLNSNAETFQRLSLQLARNGSSVARLKDNGTWPVLIFGSGFGMTRLFYSALLSQVASTGYVVIAYDTPYDTDIVVYPDGKIITANKTVAAVFDTLPLNYTALTPILNADLDVHAQDASFIITSFNDNSFSASVIPGCNSCLNTTHVGYFGHSVGGATAVTLMGNDSRVVGGIDFDGAVSGKFVKQGFDKPFMLMTVTGQTREGAEAKELKTHWAELWSHLRGPKFDLILNDAKHNTYTDFPLIFELLGILPTNQTILTSLQVTRMNGVRAHHIVTNYATTFFDWLLKGASDDLLKSPSEKFPEISIDTGSTEEFSNGTVVSAVNGTVIDRGARGQPGVKNSATLTSVREKWLLVILSLMTLLVI